MRIRWLRLAAADLQFTFHCFGCGLLAALAFDQLCFEPFHCFVAVGVLAAFGLGFDDDAGWEMGDADCRFGFVDVLAAGTGGAECVDLEVSGVDRDVCDFVGFWNNRDGGC